MDAAMRDLEALLNERFAALAARMPGPVPPHELRFSKRITTSWALIYFRRHLVRLSPYVFLLEPGDLKHGTYWAELDATVKHEVVHAYLYARDRTRAHTDEFHGLLGGLGVASNGACDLGPTNLAFRYRYACAACDRAWLRRTPLRGNWSCGRCSPGRYAPEFRMALAETLPSPWARLGVHGERVVATVEEGREALARDAARTVAVVRYPTASEVNL